MMAPVGVVSDTAQPAGPVLERLLELVDERVEPERAPAVRAFTKAYLHRLAGEAEERPPEQLFSEALGAFELATGRDGAPAAVRAFNPTPTEHGYRTTGSVLETNTEDLPFLV